MLPHPASIGALKPRIMFLEKIAMSVQHVPEPGKRLLITVLRQMLPLLGVGIIRNESRQDIQPRVAGRDKADAQLAVLTEPYGLVEPAKPEKYAPPYPQTGCPCKLVSERNGGSKLPRADNVLRLRQKPFPVPGPLLDIARPSVGHVRMIVRNVQHPSAVVGDQQVVIVQKQDDWLAGVFQPGIPGSGRPALSKVVDDRGFRPDVTGKGLACRDPASVINNNDFSACRECCPCRLHCSNKTSGPVLCRNDY